MQTTSIYCLCEPGTKTIRYFGKANNPKNRYVEHVREAIKGNRVHAACWIRKLLKTEQRPDVHVLCKVPRDDFARFERAFIYLGREAGLNLTNITEGGDSPPGKTGKKLSEETKQKLRVPKSEGTCLKFRTKKSTNTSGFVGISKNARLGKWVSVFGLHSKTFYVGVFSKLEDAVFARALAIANL